MERPEELLIFLIQYVILGFLGVVAVAAVLIYATRTMIHNSNGIRFSLRTLLITMTLVAAGLGVAVYVFGNNS